jgi:spore maturation protein CgeB
VKIFLLAEYYTNYLNDFYSKNDFSALSYDEHLEKLLDDYFGSFVSYYRHFKRLGHDVRLVIANDYALQNKWLRENNFNIMAQKNTKQSVVLEQIQAFEPDVFFLGSMFEYYGNFLAQVSQITQNIFTWIACPYPKNLDFSNVSCVISSADFLVQEFRNNGLNSEKLDAAFDADILNFLGNTKKYDVSFVGGLSKSTHSVRVQSLEKLIHNGVDIKLFGYGLKKPFWPWESRALNNAYIGEVWGMQMYQALADSRMTLNFHIDMAQGWAGNMRLYEATGCGSLLFTEETNNIMDKFVPSKEVVTYKNIDDLQSKLYYYINNQDESESIARSGQNACNERHGYVDRILDFYKIIQRYSK